MTTVRIRWIGRVGKTLLMQSISLTLSGCVMEDYDLPDTTQQLPQANIIHEATLQEARDYLESDTQFDAFVALQDEATILRWGDADLPINTHSVRKSILSALYGIAEAKGLLRLDQTLGDLDIDEPETPLTATERSATIEDLLTPRSGIYLEASGETKTMRDERPARGQHQPGEAFYYNNWNFNVLGVIFEQKTGMSIGQALNDWIARPIGMTTFQPEHVIYTNEGNSRYRQFVIFMSASDLARLGVLYVQEGRWSGNQIIPAEWVVRSTTPYSVVDRPEPFDGYGYMWWLDADAHTTWADGWRGQYMLIDPAHRMVVVSRNDTGRDVVSILWARLFGKDGFRSHHQHLHAQMIKAVKPR